MYKTAIIGTGIAGMGCGHFLHPHTDLHLYEQNDYVGGHTNTVTLEEKGQPIYIDTGFMVFNYETYPNLCRLFEMIGAPVKKTDMSFSVQHLPTGLEYSGTSLNHLFAQRRNLLKPSFFKMLWQIRRFNTESVKILNDPRYAGLSLGQYVKEFDFGEDMLWKYLVPMSSAVWSTPMDKMLDFPAATLIRFFQNHGFLGMDTQHQWWTLEKGSQAYREILIQPFRDRIRVNRRVVKVIREGEEVNPGGNVNRGTGLDSGGVRRSEWTERRGKTAENVGERRDRESQGVIIVTEDGHSERYDRVILACHADQALALLDVPSAEERRLLGAFHYQYNRAVLHTDASMMPRKKLAWSSWNYRIREVNGQLAPSTLYWMNKLQGVSGHQQYFVSINPQSDLDPRCILREIDYEHPLFDIPAIRAQQGLQQLNRQGPVYFCGSYFNYGFHEDALTSALHLCTQLLGIKDAGAIWQGVPGSDPK